MYNILITAGGTATSWHITQVIQKYFKNYFKVIVADTNPKELVASSKNADEYIKVPEVTKDSYYYEYMMSVLIKYKIDIIIPLIDADILLFYEDNPNLIDLNIISIAPNKKIIDLLNNKQSM